MASGRLDSMLFTEITWISSTWKNERTVNMVLDVLKEVMKRSKETRNLVSCRIGFF